VNFWFASIAKESPAEALERRRLVVVLVLIEKLFNPLIALVPA